MKRHPTSVLASVPSSSLQDTASAPFFSFPVGTPQCGVEGGRTAVSSVETAKPRWAVCLPDPALGMGCETGTPGRAWCIRPR